MKNPTQVLNHKWVAIEVTPVIVFRQPASGDLRAIVDEEAPSEIKLGCCRCDATPEEGWGTVCPGEE